MRIFAGALALVAVAVASCAGGTAVRPDKVGSVSANNCVAPADTVAPAITHVALSRRVLDLSNGKQTLRVLVHAEDKSAGAVSGVHSIKVEADGPKDEKVLHLRLVRGSAEDGTWAAPIRLTQHDNSGRWYLRLFEINDGAGNGIYYIRNSGSPPSDVYDPRLRTSWQQTFTVTGTPTRPPHRPGHPTALTMTPRAINATTHGASFDVRARLAGPAPRQVQFQVGGFGPGGSDYVGRIELQRQDKVWSGVFPVSRWVGSSTAQVALVARYRHDVSPNYRFFYPDKLAALGLPNKVTIASGRDTSDPRLTSFAFTPTAIDTTTQPRGIRITATANDDQSGVASVYVRFAYGSSKVVPLSTGLNPPPRPPAPIGTNVDLFAKLVRHGDVWTGDITVPACVHGGTWQAGVDVTDGARRSRDYDDTALRAVGLPSTLDVTSTPVDTALPTITAAKVSAAHHTIVVTFDHGMRSVSPTMLTIYPTVPRADRYDRALAIQQVACNNATSVVACDGSGGPITSATLNVGATTAGASYEVWANLRQAVPQLIDTQGYAIDPEYGPQGRAAP
ncbi:MAG TPA: hypothetical protein VHV76_14140 [Mycobacteriales bacterium]|nr:hypothetical protein [Mycobacteriales bacterium]